VRLVYAVLPPAIVVTQPPIARLAAKARMETAAQSLVEATERELVVQPLVVQSAQQDSVAVLPDTVERQSSTARTQTVNSCTEHVIVTQHRQVPLPSTIPDLLSDLLATTRISMTV
jgi:hypothetical protein